MNAERPNTPIKNVPNTAIPVEPPHPHHQPPMIDPDNSLVRWLKSAWESVKSPKLGSPKVLAVILLLLLGIGVWWWYSTQNAKATSARWTAYERVSSNADLDKIAADNKDNTTGKLARLEKARNLLGPQGVGPLQTERKKAERAKAIVNIETARDEFVKLADDFKKDATLRTQCLSSAADAELALVGWPKVGAPAITDDPNNYRGSVDKVVDLLKQAATAIGPNTDPGKAYTARAADLEKKKAEVFAVQQTLYDYLNNSWEPVDVSPKPPKDPISTDPIQLPKPPVIDPKLPTPPVVDPKLPNPPTDPKLPVVPPVPPVVPPVVDPKLPAPPK